MSLILNIDSSVELASLCLAKDGIAINTVSNEKLKDHAAWMHPAINELLRKENLTLKDVDAVAVSIGPGSYTGLRVALASAKGLCYAMNIPLITIGTLEIMAHAVKDLATDLICPMIDARRMEVFTAVYDKNVNPVISPQPMIIDENSFASLLPYRKMLFCGNGVTKLQAIISNSNALFSNHIVDATGMAYLSYQQFCKKEFADLAYVEPLYIKEFYSATRKPGS